MAEHYLGIDVGWSAKADTTGLCLITLDQDGLRWKCRNTGTPQARRRKDLKELIERDTVLNGVGIDGHLAGGLEPVNHYRAADALLTGGTGNIFGERIYTMPTTSSDSQSLHHHATKLANLVLELREQSYLGLADASHWDSIHKYRIVEAFPSAFLAFLLSDEDFQETKGKSAKAYWGKAVRRGYLRELIQLLLPDCQLKDLDKDLRQMKNRNGQYGHQRDAFICALTAMCVANHKYVAVGDSEYGDIMLPPRKAWGYDATGQHRWAETALKESKNFFFNQPQPRVNDGSHRIE